MSSEIAALSEEVIRLREQITALENTPGVPWRTIGELYTHLVAAKFYESEAKSKERARTNWTRCFVTLKEWQELYNFADNKMTTEFK